MKEPDTITQEVEKTLRSLDDVERIGPQPFFYTRLRARLDRLEEKPREGLLSWLWQPRVQWALLACLLLINIGVLIGSASSSRHEEYSRAEWLESMAEEYAFSSSDLYENEAF